MSEPSAVPSDGVPATHKSRVSAERSLRSKIAREAWRPQRRRPQRAGAQAPGSCARIYPISRHPPPRAPPHAASGRAWRAGRRTRSEHTLAGDTASLPPRPAPACCPLSLPPPLTGDALLPAPRAVGDLVRVQQEVVRGRRQLDCRAVRHRLLARRTSAAARRTPAAPRTRVVRPWRGARATSRRANSVSAGGAEEGFRRHMLATPRALPARRRASARGGGLRVSHVPGEVEGEGDRHRSLWRARRA